MSEDATVKLPRVPVVGDVVVYTKRCTPHTGPAIGGVLQAHAALILRSDVNEAVASLRGHVPDAYNVSLKVFDHNGETYFMRTVPFTPAAPGSPEAEGRWAWRRAGERSITL